MRKLFLDIWSGRPDKRLTSSLFIGHYIRHWLRTARELVDYVIHGNVDGVIFAGKSHLQGVARAKPLYWNYLFALFQSQTIAEQKQSITDPQMVKFRLVDYSGCSLSKVFLPLAFLFLHTPWNSARFPRQVSKWPICYVLKIGVKSWAEGCSHLSQKGAIISLRYDKVSGRNSFKLTTHHIPPPAFENTLTYSNFVLYILLLSQSRTIR